jgi:hypothetical protein
MLPEFDKPGNVTGNVALFVHIISAFKKYKPQLRGRQFTQFCDVCDNVLNYNVKLDT